MDSVALVALLGLATAIAGGTGMWGYMTSRRQMSENPSVSTVKELIDGQGEFSDRLAKRLKLTEEQLDRTQNEVARYADQVHALLPLKALIIEIRAELAECRRESESNAANLKLLREAKLAAQELVVEAKGVAQDVVDEAVRVKDKQ